jgi:hypothetical protein
MSSFMSGEESHVFAASPCELCESEFSDKLTRELGRELAV